MDTKTTEKIIKLLNLSSSPEDGEALSSIRKVHSILKDYNINFDSIVFQDKNTKKAKPAESSDESEDIDEMFNFLHANGKINGFLESLENAFHKYGRLTEKQLDCLVRAYNQARYGKRW